MTTADLDPPRRVLAVGAHPDDIEFGCGATLAKWSDAGAEVHLLVLTDGSKGTWDASAERARLVATRAAEQDEAAGILGVRAVHRAGFVDGELGAGHDEQAAVCEIIRQTRPVVLLTHDPWKRYRLHPDHRNAGQLTLDAVVAARDPHFFPEQHLTPHRPQLILLFEAEVVDHVESVDGYLDRKVDALLAHRSQWRSTMEIDTTSPDGALQRQQFVERIRSEATNAASGTATRMAEGFKRIDGI